MKNNSNAIEISNISISFNIKKEITDPLTKKTHKKTIINTVYENFSLNVKKGEILGIVGRNGCGKSTLLSIIARILEPDKGTIQVSGKIASILALSMGFHQDMSGRENIYLRGELYGLSKRILDSRIDSIISYAGINEYIDNPVRTYSSGMVSRLAFSIMIHVDAEILLVDEILSTGDAGFSAKAKESFKKLLQSGKTIIYVSHNVSSVIDLCTKAIWIEKGKICCEGSPKKVCREYMKQMTESYEIISDLAIAGVADAQYRLALMYYDGSNVLKNLDQYIYWIKSAVLQGHTEAQVHYANYLSDVNEQLYYSEIMELYTYAANKGNLESRKKLALMKCPDNSMICRKLLLDLSKPLRDSKNTSDKSLYAEILLKTALTKKEYATAYRYYKELSLEDTDAMYQLATMYKDGVGTKRDIAEYINTLITASASGHLKSTILLAEYYEDGRYVEQEDIKSFEYYYRGALMGSSICQFKVAKFYEEGIGTEMDLKKSEIWYSKYSTSIYAPTQFKLATRIYPNLGSITLLETSAESNYLRSLLKLADYYYHGKVVEKNLDKAKELYAHAYLQYGKHRQTIDNLHKNKH